MLGIVARTVKDAALSLALRAYLNDRFREYGEVTDCVLDTETGRLMLEALLRGEHDAVVATIERYELSQNGDMHYVEIKTISSSREWLGTLLTRLLGGKRYAIPMVIGKLL
ncbi:MAG: hypothetical protein HYV18_02755 [Gammaproteobacteria bacterium]|nr:hypothetical protein [Gammaproteobacteria bacterium]